MPIAYAFATTRSPGVRRNYVVNEYYTNCWFRLQVVPGTPLSPKWPFPGGHKTRPFTPLRPR